MKTIGSYEAKTKFAGLLAAVEKGETYTVTRNGRPVAQIVPIRERPQAQIDAGIRGLREFRKGRTLGISIRDAIEQGRRY